MRIGLVLPGFSANERDWCIPPLLTLARQLGGEHDVRVFALRYPHQRGSYSVFELDVTALGGEDVRGAARLPFLASSLRAVIREHRRRPFDVLHAFWGDEPGFVATEAGRWLGLPSVVTVLGGELVALREIEYGGQLSRLNRWLSRSALSGATEVTVGCESMRRRVLSLRAPGSTTHLPVGVDLARFTSGAGNGLDLAGELRVLHVASLVPVKGQDVLLSAWHRLSQRVPEAHLHVVGDGPLRHHLETLAGELGIADRVHFHGAVEHHELPRYYRTAELCVSSSRHEGQGWVTQEAAACGRTTVGTAVGVLTDLVPATRAVPVDDADALASALENVLRDERERHRMERSVHQRIAEQYSMKTTVEALGAVYSRLSS